MPKEELVKSRCLTATKDCRVSVTWTLDTSYPHDSRVFEFNGADWKLRLFLNLAGRGRYTLFLKRISGKCLRPFEVSVYVLEEGGRIVPGLSHSVGVPRDLWGRFPLPLGVLVWGRRDEVVLPAFPEFLRSRSLTFRVVLKKRRGDFPSPEIGFILRSPPVPSNTVQFWTIPCQKSLMQYFSKLLEEQSSFTDVVFRCGGQSTRANGVVVSARSKVIATMLSSAMVEGRTRVVKIPNMEPEVFRHFLRYLYTGTLPELTVELAWNLYEAGDQYAVPGLVNICTEYLVENLTVQNACDVLVFADVHHNAGLKEAVIDFMVVNRVPQVSDRWKDFCEAHPMLAMEVNDRFGPKSEVMT